jgi:hypothetical protein
MSRCEIVSVRAYAFVVEQCERMLRAALIVRIEKFEMVFD